MKKLPLLLTLLIALAVAFPETTQAARSGTQDRINKLKEVQTLERQGRIDDALKILNELLDWNPKDVLVMRRVAGLYQKTGRVKNQIEILERLIKIRPSDLDLYRWLADTYHSTGQGEKAREILWQVPRVFRGKLPYYLMAANLFGNYGYLDDAVAVFKQARLDTNRPEVYAAELSRIYLQTMDFLGFCRENVGLVQRDPKNYPRIRDHLIKVGHDRGVLPRMIEVMEVLAGEAEADGWSGRLRGDLLLAAGRPREALPVYGRAARSLGSAACLVEFGLKLIDLEELLLAREALLDAQDLATPGLESNMAAHSLAAVERRLGNIDQAQYLLVSLLQREPEPWLRQNAELELGRIILFNRNNPAQALPYYESFMGEYDPRALGGEAAFELARVYFAVDRPADAESLLKLVLRAKIPGGWKERAGLELIEFDFFRDEFREAQASYRRFVRANPASDFANDAIERMRMIQKGLWTGPDALKALAQAELHRYAFRTDQAREKLENAVEADSVAGLLGYMVLTLTEIYLDTEENETAKNLLEWFVADYPDHHLAPAATFRLAAVHKDRFNDPARARTILEQMVLRDPKSPQAARARTEIELISDFVP